MASTVASGCHSCLLSCLGAHEICPRDDGKCASAEGCECDTARPNDIPLPDSPMDNFMDELFCDEDACKLGEDACLQTCSNLDESSAGVAYHGVCPDVRTCCESGECSSSSEGCGASNCETVDCGTSTNYCEDAKCPEESKCDRHCEVDVSCLHSIEAEDEGFSQDPIIAETDASHDHVGPPILQQTTATLDEQFPASFVLCRNTERHRTSEEREEVSPPAWATPLLNSWLLAPLNAGSNTSDVFFLQHNVESAVSTQTQRPLPTLSSPGETAPDASMLQEELAPAVSALTQIPHLTLSSPSEKTPGALMSQGELAQAPTCGYGVTDTTMHRNDRQSCLKKLARRKQLRAEKPPKSSGREARKAATPKRPAGFKRRIFHCRYPWSKTKKGQYCTYTATDASNRKKHERTHWETKPYACYYHPICPVRMARSDDIKRHLESGGCTYHKELFLHQADSKGRHPLPLEWEAFRTRKMKESKVEEDERYWSKLKEWLRAGNQVPIDSINQDGTDPCYVPVDRHS